MDIIQKCANFIQVGRRLLSTVHQNGPTVAHLGGGGAVLRWDKWCLGVLDYRRVKLQWSFWAHLVYHLFYIYMFHEGIFHDYLILQIFWQFDYGNEALHSVPLWNVGEYNKPMVKQNKIFWLDL